MKKEKLLSSSLIFSVRISLLSLSLCVWSYIAYRPGKSKVKLHNCPPSFIPYIINYRIWDIDNKDDLIILNDLEFRVLI